MYDVIIIGCGVVGAATAYQLARYKLKVAVLEAQNDVANGTTKANSAILHAGYDPKPGTRMAALNVEGNRMAMELCRKLDVPCRQIGSLLLALNEEQKADLHTLYQRGLANGVPGLALLDREAALAMEPGLNPALTGALYAPTAAVVNPWEYALAMAETAVVNGVTLHRRCPVTGIRPLPGGGFGLQTPEGELQTRFVVNAAGVNADRVHALLEPVSWKITPNRGSYFLLDKAEGDRVHHVIFQCPGPNGKGVLVAPTVHGNLLVGPDAQPVEDRLDLGTPAAALDFVRHQARQSVPGIDFGQNIRNFAGIRANSDQEDFILQPSQAYPAFLDLAGIKSPGLTAAPAIGKLAVGMLAEAGLVCTPKEQFADERHVVRMERLSPAEKNALIARDPRYGRVICRCETVTEGEIVAALHSPIPAVSINGIKRRCNAGMGRCQGGFCGPRVQEIIARELGIDQTAVPLDQDGSWVLARETKTGEEGCGHV